MPSTRKDTSATASQLHFTGRLAQGLKETGSIGIRLARPGEAQQISELSAEGGTPPSPTLLRALEDGRAAGTLLTHMRAPARNEHLRLMTYAVYRAASPSCMGPPCPSSPSGKE